MPGQPQPQSLLEAAFDMLTETLENFRASDREAVGANLKLELKRRSFGGFSEGRLGFSTFKQFLEAAENDGRIVIRPRPAGDLEVALPGAEKKSVATHAPSDPGYWSKSIRTDLWRCFVDWSPGWARVYNVAEGQALKFPEEAHPLEKTEHTAYRSMALATPEAFPRIDPITVETNISWMKTFAASMDSSDRGALEAALQAERPISAFTRVTRTSRDLVGRWHAFRVKQVGNVIEEWAKSNHLEIEIYESFGDSKDRRLDTSTRESDLRSRLHTLIDRLTIEELNRISVPLEFTVLQ